MTWSFFFVIAEKAAAFFVKNGTRPVKPRQHKGPY